MGLLSPRGMPWSKEPPKPKAHIQAFIRQNESQERLDKPPAPVRSYSSPSSRQTQWPEKSSAPMPPQQTTRWTNARPPAKRAETEPLPMLPPRPLNCRPGEGPKFGFLSKDEYWTPKSNAAIMRDDAMYYDERRRWFENQADVDKANCSSVTGDVVIPATATGVITFNDLLNIQGEFRVDSCKGDGCSLVGISSRNLTRIGGRLYIEGASRLQSVKLPGLRKVRGDLHLLDLPSLNELDLVSINNVGSFHLVSAPKLLQAKIGLGRGISTDPDVGLKNITGEATGAGEAVVEVRNVGLSNLNGLIDFWDAKRLIVENLPNLHRQTFRVRNVEEMRVVGNDNMTLYFWEENLMEETPGPNITRLHVSGIRHISPCLHPVVHEFIADNNPRLEYLHFNFEKLARLDVHDNPNLKKMVSWAKLNRFWKDIHIQDNPQLRLSQFPARAPDDNLTAYDCPAFYNAFRDQWAWFPNVFNSVVISADIDNTFFNETWTSLYLDSSGPGTTKPKVMDAFVVKSSNDTFNCQDLNLLRTEKGAFPGTYSCQGETLPAGSGVSLEAPMRVALVIAAMIGALLLVRILNKHPKVLLKPSSSARGALHAALAVRLTTGLDPDDTVDVGVLNRRAGGDAEARRLDVAPLSPLLAGAGQVDAALVDEEARRQALGLEVRGERQCVVRLVVGIGPLGVGLERLGHDEGVVVGHVGHDAAHRRVAARHADDLGELLGRRGQVVVPSQPAAVRGVQVQVHVVELQRPDGVGDALLVDGRRARAKLDPHVGDEVRERVGLQHHGKGEVRGRGELLGKRRHVRLLVQPQPVLGRVELARRLARAAVAVGQVVVHEADDLVLARGLLGGAGALDGRVDVGQRRNVGDPDKGARLLHLADACGVGRVADRLVVRQRRLGLFGPLRVRKQLLALERVGAFLSAQVAGGRCAVARHGADADRGRQPQQDR
ncbi:hypothetical protein PpBr36_03865 [Pyricularia pennisetigena]|uniref:hypothetical protein n=1 Tax=Pyricularia pennisetigena TaxID=1578925 RepID=UPI001150054E|nr:hypothetical protein PpBr36_03865 [Pyricularia pennisetigena]TLS30183.1 hypothetical protein PpBr36_03865 [Pyricularia pennisetigena]